MFRTRCEQHETIMGAHGVHLTFSSFNHFSFRLCLSLNPLLWYACTVVWRAAIVHRTIDAAMVCARAFDCACAAFTQRTKSSKLSSSSFSARFRSKTLSPDIQWDSNQLEMNTIHF